MTSLARKLRNSWHRLWFADGSPYDLAAARIIISVHALWLLMSRDLAPMAGLPDYFVDWIPLSSRVRFLHFIPDVRVEYLIQGLTLTALVLAVLGVRPRISCLIAGLLLYHLAPLEAYFHGTGGADSRGFGLSILCLIVLAFSACGDRWSVRPRPAAAGKREAWQYHWPVLLMQMFIVQVYFFSGWAKLMIAGFDWVSAEQMRRLILITSQRHVVAFESVGPVLADFPALLFVMAVSTLIMELGFPVLLFWRESRRFFIPLAVTFHVGALLMFNFFFMGTPRLLLFVNWDWTRQRARHLTTTMGLSSLSSQRGSPA